MDRNNYDPISFHRRGLNHVTVLCGSVVLRPHIVHTSKKHHDKINLFAYNLVVTNSFYRQHLGEKMTLDSGFLDKTIEEQFKRLFIAPFISNRIDGFSALGCIPR